MSEEFQTWKEHFIEQAKGLVPPQKNFYKVSMQHGRGKEPTIKMVAPTEQVVERAKSSLADPPPAQPPSIYDPVTGVMQQSSEKHKKAHRTRKRKRSMSVKRKYSKKRRVSKPKKKKNKKKGIKRKTIKRRTPLKKKKSKKTWWA